jgi:predicted lipid-binding transport protein (Tim44 family)
MSNIVIMGMMGIIGIAAVSVIISAFFWLIKNRKSNSLRTELQDCPSVVATPTDTAESEKISVETGDERSGFDKIRQHDPSFDENMFKEHISAFFLLFQAARTKSNISELRQQITEDMFALLKGEEDKLVAEGKINKIENIAIHSVDLTDAWQENGRDFIKARYLSDFLDYCVEETTEAPVCGIMGEKIDYTKDWIFSRISGKNPWYLAAMEQV